MPIINSKIRYRLIKIMLSAQITELGKMENIMEVLKKLYVFDM